MLPSALTWGRGCQHFHSESTFSCGIFLTHLCHYSTFHFLSITSLHLSEYSLKAQTSFNESNRCTTKLSWLINRQYFVSLMKDPSTSKEASLHLSYLWQVWLRPLASAPCSWVTASLRKGHRANRSSLSHCMGTALPCSHSLTQCKETACPVSVFKACDCVCKMHKHSLALTAMGLDQTCAGTEPTWAQGSTLPCERQASTEGDLHETFGHLWCPNVGQ